MGNEARVARCDCRDVIHDCGCKFIHGGAASCSDRCAVGCKGCHDEIGAQHAESTHEASITDPVFQAQYFSEVLPRARQNAAILDEAARCTACHSPATFVKINGAIRDAKQVDPGTSGVTCDFCVDEPGDRDP